MKDIFSEGFWSDFDLHQIQIDGFIYYLAGDLNEILADFKLRLSDAVYNDPDCRVILTSLNDESGKDLDTSTSLIVPIQKITTFLEPVG